MSFLRVDVRQVIIVNRHDFLGILKAGYHSILVPRQGLQRVIRRGLFNFLVLNINVVNHKNHKAFNRGFISVIVIMIMFIMSTVKTRTRHRVIFSIQVIQNPAQLM